MSRHMGLVIKAVLLRVDSRRNIECQKIPGASSKLCRVLSDCDGVQIYHRIKTLVFITEGNPVLQRSQIIAQRQIARSLHSAE